MRNTLDVELQDMEQFDEICLLGELMVLASESQGTLDPGLVDVILGLTSSASPHLPDQRRAS